MKSMLESKPAYWYTLDDMEEANIRTWSLYTGTINFSNIRNRLNILDTLLVDYTDSSIALANELFSKYIYPRYHNYYWLVSDKTLDFQARADYPYECITEKPVINLRCKIVDFYNTTIIKYKKVIEAFNVELSQLLKDININSDNKAISNDTPQSGGGVELFADKYASFIQHNIATTTQDTRPYLDKINNLNDNYINVMSEWCYEFRRYLNGLEVDE